MTTLCAYCDRAAIDCRDHRHGDELLKQARARFQRFKRKPRARVLRWPEPPQLTRGGRSRVA